MDADNRGGTRRAVEYLVEQGRRRIATIAGPPDRRTAGPPDTTVGADRLAGYREALPGGREPAGHGDFSVSAGGREMERRGRRVPDDVAIVGDAEAGADPRSHPEPRTVHQPTEAMGRRSAELLLDRIHGRPVADTPVICETRLIVRESS
ncbi:substrate-binding domain-containing protein [Actinomadura sp. NAK00032]|uniref:substrate-binding domain-containing protein n=1 Tax=Actinomadura sp. NAK00032 TaxID=2742128 RepID=UPI0015918226|nr:substrate-binding domain-containing protein [Actinomadura sp. NAK00032]QKW37817.1 substrate-binding domain-containing protein [Actinomadura sp. NAK00032]